MVDLNNGINIIKHNLTGGSSSAHAGNMPANMRDPKNNNFNTQNSINIFYFIVIFVKKYAEKWYQLLYYRHPGIWRYYKNKMLRSDWLKTDFYGFLYKESDSEVRFGVTIFLKKFDGPCNISMTSYGVT